MIQKDHEKNFENLSRIMKLYGNEFESRSDKAGAMWVEHDMKADYLVKVQDIFERINFVNSQVLSVSFKKSGALVSNSGGNPESDFDEALVLIRYEFVMSPSVILKNKIVKQRWVLKPGGVWNLIPDLSVFYE